MTNTYTKQELDLIRLIKERGKLRFSKRGRRLIPRITLYTADPFIYKGVLNAHVARDRNNSFHLSWMGCDEVNVVLEATRVEMS